MGPESRFRGRHHERLHRGLHGRARHERRMGRRRLLREPREDRRRFSALADARAVVRGSPADRSEVSQAEGPRRVGPGDRGRGRSRRLRPDHADRRQPAERSAHPRNSTAASRCRCRTSSTPTSARCPTASARSSRGTRRKSSGRRRWGALGQRADHRDSRSARARLGPDGRSRHRDAAGLC